MRDKRFIAEHRGGTLKIEQHRQLMGWAIACAEHVLPLAGNKIDKRLTHALAVAKAWTKGNATVGEARHASVGAHGLARESKNPATIAVARAVGHAVATAHMADHALGSALFGLIAVKQSGKSVTVERRWQNKRLPPAIKKLVLETRSEKEAHFKDLKH